MVHERFQIIKIIKNYKDI